ncbi:MAG: hypothetical protein FWD48_11005 [Oscillospiraceae bacterium]|nr:hypothetical protein [Oscillospiraceae bacterium]
MTIFKNKKLKIIIPIIVLIVGVIVGFFVLSYIYNKEENNFYTIEVKPAHSDPTWLHYTIFINKDIDNFFVLEDIFDDFFDNYYTYNEEGSKNRGLLIISENYVISLYVRILDNKVHGINIAVWDKPYDVCEFTGNPHEPFGNEVSNEIRSKLSNFVEYYNWKMYECRTSQPCNICKETFTKE